MNKRVLFLTLFTTAIAVLALSFLSRDLADNTIDDFPEDGIAIDITTQARIINGDEFAAEIGSIDYINNLAADLHYFGTTVHPEYENNETDLIGFEIKTYTRNENVYEVVGRYGISSREITVSVEPLNNGQIHTSMRELGSDLNLDSELPSNSPKNQFIGILPITTPDYVIDYVTRDDFFSITSTGDTSQIAEAEKIIQDALGDTYSPDDVFIYGAGSSVNNNF